MVKYIYNITVISILIFHCWKSNQIQIMTIITFYPYWVTFKIRVLASLYASTI